MAVKLKPLNEQVIVITGASSGIGLATAQRAAKKGAKVVMVSRNEAALRDLQQKIAAEGGEVTYVVADVADRAALQVAADRAVSRFGRIDTWVNDAGLGLFGKIEEISDEDHRKLFETNYWGVVNGSTIAVKHLRKQGGALINVGSVVSDQVVALQSVYSATKHAVKGFTDGLRMELEADGAPISVTLIKPAAIDTPFPQHARNYMDEEPKLPAPVYPPEEVARAILNSAVHPMRDVYVGGGGKLMSTLNKHVPRLMDKINSGLLVNQQQRRGEAARNPLGSLYEPGQDGKVRGGHPGHVAPFSAYTRATTHPLITGAAVVLAGAALAAAFGGAFLEERRQSLAQRGRNVGRAVWERRHSVW